MDHEVEIFRLFMKNACAEMKPMVTDAIIEEHAADPLGRHSLDLEHLLVFMRQLPQEDKLVILAEEQDRRFRLFRLSGVRSLPGQIVGEKVYESEEEALHAGFLQRLADLGLLEDKNDQP